jgi:hypothetical protein
MVLPAGSRVGSLTSQVKMLIESARQGPIACDIDARWERVRPTTERSSQRQRLEPRCIGIVIQHLGQRSTARSIGEPRSRLTIQPGRRVGPLSERQVEPKCFIEFGTQRAVEGPDQCSNALDINRSNLLGLSF